MSAASINRRMERDIGPRVLAFNMVSLYYYFIVIVRNSESIKPAIDQASDRSIQVSVFTLSFLLFGRVFLFSLLS